MASSLGTNTDLMLMLLDVPFLGVGLTAIAMFIFVLFLKNITLLFVYLYSASLFAFAAAILDLSNVLVVGVQTDSIQNHGLPTTPLATIREIFLSLSLGFLFLYLWLAVAQCPQNERRTLVNVNSTTPDNLLHSGSWKRWGLLGMVLQWSTLAACVSIPLLQMLWRILKAQHFYGNVYIAESTIQTVLCFIFILKLFLNVSLSRFPRWKVLFSYFVPLLSLTIGTSLGIMNVVQFYFSETLTGRFLRATEIYLLIIYSLVARFYQSAYTASEATFSEAPTTAPVFPEKEPPGGRTAALVTSEVLLKPVSPEATYGSHPHDSFSLLQTQSGPYRFSRRPTLVSAKPDVVGEFYAQEAESSVTNHYLRSSRATSDTETAIQTGNKYDAALLVSEDLTAIGNLSLSRTSPTARGEERIKKFNMRATPSLDSFDKLLSQQKELDNSIAALRILSPPQSPLHTISPLQTYDAQSTIEFEQETAPDHRGRESTSGRSDFSLSNFPRPPTISDSDSSIPVPRSLRSSEDHLNLSWNAVDEDNGSQKMDRDVRHSGTAHYVATSFVGDSYDLGKENKSPFIGDLERSQLREQTTEGQPYAGLKPMFLSASHPTPPMVQDTESSGTSVVDPRKDVQRSPVERENGVPSLRPLLLGTSIPAPLYPAAMFSSLVPIGSQRNRGRSNALRPTISSPRPLPELASDGGHGTYERPRPPPVKPQE